MHDGATDRYDVLTRLAHAILAGVENQKPEKVRLRLQEGRELLQKAIELQPADAGVAQMLQGVLQMQHDMEQSQASAQAQVQKKKLKRKKKKRVSLEL
jgi:hypothetical protein